VFLLLIKSGLIIIALYFIPAFFLEIVIGFTRR